MTTIELTEEDAAILRELIAERKDAKAHREMMQSFSPKKCVHGVTRGVFCINCTIDEAFEKWPTNKPCKSLTQSATAWNTAGR